MITIRFFLTRLHMLRVIIPLLTVKKVVNLLHAIVRFVFRTTRTVTHPPILVLTITTHCNYACRMCLKSRKPDSAKGEIVDYSNPREMDFAQMKALLEEHADYLCLVRLHGGEPLRHARFTEIVDLLNELRIPFNIITNGSLLDEDLCEKLVGSYCFNIGVSLDAGTPETYRYIRRGGELSAVLANIERINELKAQRRSPRPVLSVSMAAFKANIGEVPQLLHICHDYHIPTLTVGEGYDYDTDFITAEQLIENNKELVRGELAGAVPLAKKLGVFLRLRFPVLADDDERPEGVPRQVGWVTPKNCLNLYASIWMMPDFTAVGCSATTMTWGNVSEKGVETVWNDPGGLYATARRDLRHHKVPEPCGGCIFTGGFVS